MTIAGGEITANAEEHHGVDRDAEYHRDATIKA
jgi:hypothetical protein